MEFQAPACLLLGVLVVLPWLKAGRLTPTESRRDPRHSLIRSVVFLLVVLAMARPVQVTESSARSRAFLWDRSASVSADADAVAREKLVEVLRESQELEPRPTLTIVEIGAGEGIERAPLDSEFSFAHVAIDGQIEGALVSPLATGLAAAVRCGGGSSAHSVTVLSDGLGTDLGQYPVGDSAPLASAAKAMAQDGIVLDWWQLPLVAGDLRVTGVRPVGPLFAGLTGEINVSLEGGGQVVDLVLTAGGYEVARAEGQSVDGATSVTMSFEPEDAGFVDVRVEAILREGVDPREGAPREDGSSASDLVLSATLPVQPSRSLLYFGGRFAESGSLLSELIGPGFVIRDGGDHVRSGADGMTAAQVAALGLGANDLIVVDDRPAARMPRVLQEAIVRAVKHDGVGLLMSGGEAAFGPGGYHDQPLEEILPVEFVQKEEKRDPSTTLVVIIDTSGSMGGNRVQLAKEVSRLAIRRLLPHDKVGLVEFYGAKRWAVPIQPASNSIEIERALNRLDAGGGTVILPAIEEAYYGLKNVRTRYKHVLILTDGGVENGSFEPLLRRMADDGMTVSTVLIGPDAHSEFLVNIANWGQGRFYSVPNRFSLPEILLKQPASAKLPAYRPGVTPVASPTVSPAWWGEVDPVEGIPALGGYVETRLRSGASSVLETAEERHPIVASWRYGLGRVTAMTTEPTGPGTEPWANWEGYGEFMSRVLERTAADTSEPFAFRLTPGAGEALLVAERRTADESQVPSGQLIRADLMDSTPVAWDRVAPDRYEVRIPLFSPSASVRVSATSSSQGRASRPSTFLALDAATVGSPEFQVPAAAGDALLSLAQWSGGQVLPIGGAAGGVVAQAAGNSPVEDRTRLREWSPLLALLALLTYLADIVYRRWPRAVS